MPANGRWDLIRRLKVNGDGESSGYAENPDNWIFILK